MSDAPNNYNKLQWKSAGCRSEGHAFAGSLCQGMKCFPCWLLYSHVLSHIALAQDSVRSYVHLLRQVIEPTALVFLHLFKTTGGFLLPPPEFSCLAFNDWNSFGWE